MPLGVFIDSKTLMLNLSDRAIEVKLWFLEQVPCDSYLHLDTFWDTCMDLSDFTGFDA